MLRKPDLMQLLTALVRMNDARIVEDDGGLPQEVCAAADRPRVREIVARMAEIRQAFNYLESPEFRELVADKSAHVRAMHEKLARDPAKRRAQLERLDHAFESLLASEEIGRLLAGDQRASADQIRALAQSLSNPD